jgi:Transposase DDE domain
MINIEQITSVFTKLPIEEIGNLSGFIKKENKLTALSFILSFFTSFSDGNGWSTSIWVQNLSRLIGVPLTKYGFTKRLGWLCVTFCERLLSDAIHSTLCKAVTWQNEAKWLSNFNRVFLEDSTILKLPESLHGIFGGGANQKEAYALTRVQLRMDLTREKIQKISINSYRETDLSFAPNILDDLRQGDLVIRDLGYFVIEVFEKIQWLGAYFISRWHPNVQFRYPLTNEILDMGQFLAKAEQKGVEFIDQNFLLGLTKVFSVRFIAIKVPQDIEAKRRKAALEREKKSGKKYSEKYFEHLGWAIYITNIPMKMFDFSCIWAIYRLRWRIEIIFKAWKSHLNLLEAVKDNKCSNPCQIIIRLYLMMAWIVLGLIPAYNFFMSKLYQTEKRFLSLARFADYYRNNFENIVNEQDWEKHIPFIKCFCLYEKRQKHRNYFEKSVMVNLY